MFIKARERILVNLRYARRADATKIGTKHELHETDLELEITVGSCETKLQRTRYLCVGRSISNCVRFD